MSADNWAVCPRCRKRHEAAHIVLCQQVADGYGVLTVDEFDALREKAAEGVNFQQEFREDYEFWLDMDGIVHVSYSGHCQACGFGIDFTDEHQIPGLDAATPEEGTG